MNLGLGCSVRPTVLVIDDNERYGRALAQGLQDDGFGATAVGSGEYALNCVLDAPPDATVIDLNLAEDDVPGFLVLKALRRRFSEIPVIVITGHYLETPDEVEARALGVSDYLFKPFEICELSACLRTALAGEQPPANPRDHSTEGKGTFARTSSEPSSYASHSDVRSNLGKSRMNECENAFIDAYLGRLNRTLRRRFPNTDPHVIGASTADALLEFVSKLEAGNWPRAQFARHLYKAAWRNVADALQWFARRRTTEARYAEPVTVVVEPEVAAHCAGVLEGALQVLADTPAERQALLLWIDGASQTEIADALTPEAAGDEARVREAKRFKDRIRKRARDRRQAVLRALGREP